MKVYGLKLAKILARFQPISLLLTQPGYFVQRNDDSLVYFALSNFLAAKLGNYPFLPLRKDCRCPDDSCRPLVYRSFRFLHGGR